MTEVDENGYKYLGVLEGADNMQKKMKENVRQDCMMRVKLVAKSKLYSGNFIKAINMWAIGVVRYSAGSLDWSDRELKAMDVKTRMRLTMFEAFHEKGSVPRLYMKREDGGRWLIKVFDCVKQEELALSEYVKATDEWMLDRRYMWAKRCEVGNEYKKRVQKERMKCFMAKRLHGKFMRDVSKEVDARSRQWLRASYLGKGEGYVFAAQDQALRTRLFRATIEREDVDLKCRVYKKKSGVNWTSGSGCSGLA